MTEETKSELSAIAKTLAANNAQLRVLGCYKATGYAPSPRDIAQQLQEELDGLGHTLKIEWKWQGRNRDGVVSIFDRAGACVYSVTYTRAETRWDENDELLTSCNRGSHKHFALIAALAFMRSLPRRKCGGICDSLVS